MSYWGNTKRREEGGSASRIKLPSHQQQQQQQRAVSVCVCVCGVCVCSQILVQMRSEKDLPGPHWFSVLEPNLWVCAPRRKAWKLGSSSSQDEWEEGAHQRAEPSGWAQIGSLFWTHARHFHCFTVDKWTSNFWMSLCIFCFSLGGMWLVLYSPLLLSPEGCVLFCI